MRALVRPRPAALAGLTLGATLACADADADDPLARATLEQLAQTQGSATGDARTGQFAFDFTTEACDCPAVELDGQRFELCSLAELDAASASVAEGSGLLAISLTDAILLSGAIEADASFVVAGIQDLGSLGGELEALRRLDGSFDADASRAEGWAGQRLVGESLTGDAIDCRWTGRFVGVRQ